jgi:O-antigen/teichoic acid export membrane protein
MEKIRQLVNYSIFSFIANIAEQLRFKVDNLIIASVLGFGLVTHYNIGARINQYYLIMIINAIAIIIPVFSKMEGIGNYENIRKKYIFIAKLNTIISVFLGGTILIYGKAFIARWMGPDYMDSYTVLLILCIGLMFNTIQVSSRSLLFGISKHKFYSITMLGEGILNILLSILLIKKYGILGVAIGTTIPMLITSIFITPVYATHVINLSFLKYTKVVASVIVVGGAIHLGSWLIVKNMIKISYQRIFLLGIITSIVFLLISFFVLMNRKERKYFKIPF